MSCQNENEDLLKRKGIIMLTAFRTSQSLLPSQFYRYFSEWRKQVVATNLATRVTAEILENHMRQAGLVKTCEIVKANDAGGNRKALVEFQRIVSADKAVSLLNNSTLMGKKLKVTKSPPVLQTPASTGPANITEQIGVICSKLFLHNLSFDVTSQHLESYLQKLKINISSAHIITTRTGKATGLGIVELSSTEDADRAMNLITSKPLHGRQVQVREDRVDLIDDVWKDNQDEIATQSEGYVPEGYATKSVFVGNLPLEITSHMLKGHMSQVGPVLKATVLRGKKNMSLGCGIVVYETEEAAQRAFSDLHDSELMGRLIFVREDRETQREVSLERKHWRSKGVGKRHNPKASVYIGNLAWDVDAEALERHLARAGDVKKVVLFEKDGRKMGNGLVEFTQERGARNALEMFKGSKLRDRPLFMESYIKQ